MAEKRLDVSQIPVLPGVANARGLKLLGAATTPSSIGGTGGPVDIAGLSFVINVDIPQQVVIVISCQGIQTETLLALNTLFYSIDGTDYAGISNIIGGPALNAVGPGSAARIHFLTAGTHTIKGRADNPGGANRNIFGPIHIMAFGTDSDLGGGGGQQAAGGSSALVKVESELTAGGPFSNTAFSYVDVPGATVSFTLTEPKIVLFVGEAHAFRDDANGGRQNTQIGINIDGTDYNGGSVDTATLAEFVSAGTMVHKAVLLAAGPHTATLRFRRHQAGNSGNAIFLCDTDHTIRLTGVYTEPVFGIGSLTRAEAENATGTADANSTTTYALLSGTSVSFNLETEKVVLFEGFCDFYRVGSDLVNGQLGVRVDGVDYDGSVALSGSVAQELTAVVQKTLLLAPGIHTAQLVFRQVVGGGDPARVINGTTKPSRLTAVWTAPSAASLILANSFVDTTSGDFTTGAPYPGVAIPGAIVAFQQSVIGDILVHVDARASFATSDDTAVGVQLDAGAVVIVGGNLSGSFERGKYFGGTVHFPAVPAGAHTITAYLMDAGYAGGAAWLARDANRPLRIVVNHN
jgi:hypothetical protein